ncbi:helix-turn-helix domain-containing protein [Mycolicibacterium gadium]|uniref:Helix-turn-helix domain-containing protein n=1 Tax=Mycolicibacterium gadium TaxID=1794 RepID=A0ABT6GQA2_MYCGU|nr:helix-turn-helix domain-containing protein [Mycolicibacterium gadium]MDG5483342.1 helix-turn-helix domain-containing protein [Mycolicibacterium gadium]
MLPTLHLTLHHVNIRLIASGHARKKAGTAVDTKPRLLVSISDAREVLGGIGHSTIYELVSQGEIIKVNIGRRGFITSESLDAYVSRLTRSETETA